MNGVELSLFASRIAAICEEAGAVLGCAAFSPNIRDRLDYSCALFDAQGQLLGQATHIPVHLGSMAFAMGGLVRSMSWEPGDMVMLNDPYHGGTHLPDMTFIAPVFVGDELAGFCANRAHHADIGAEAPGSMPLSGDLSEEGFLIAPVKVIRGDEWQPEVLEPLLQRLSDRAASFGDFSAQAAANRVACRRFAGLGQRLGTRRLAEQGDALQEYAARLASASLAELPAGSYAFSDLLDDDGQGSFDIPIHVRLDIGDGRVVVDFAGTSGQVPGNVNCPLSVTAAAVFYVFRCLMPAQVPACHGAMRGIELRAPEGSLVNARYPAAVAAGNVETSTRIVDVVCGALAGALPERVPAAAQGSMNNVAMGARSGAGWNYYETIAGGHGAAGAGPGLAARHSHMTNTLNTPVEVLERHYPLRVERYAVRAGSGGAGRHAGGDGVVRVYRFLQAAAVTLLTERRRHPPWGLAGGQPGQKGCNRLDGEILPGKASLQVRAGQVLSLETPGGGGWGEASGPSVSSSG